MNCVTVCAAIALPTHAYAAFLELEILRGKRIGKRPALAERLLRFSRELSALSLNSSGELSALSATRINPNPARNYLVIAYAAS